MKRKIIKWRSIAGLSENNIKAISFLKRISDKNYKIIDEWIISNIRIAKLKQLCDKDYIK